ncbi:hypothetical protein PRIPAC_89271 [Pristionchus pacificus]|uniref:Uncharacterized protein n=1 Tax=Pristionchus pacificus TaxID=54126 RepID=A0A2A6B6F4_PRIPA|nr:hypothetical protein PRIPAC_89271 [Pristionchus pacificus]|eukprot:PDM61457.1 hypothetical protein PRIPAC_50899 [Pristionchus pacificus]
MDNPQLDFDVDRSEIIDFLDFHGVRELKMEADDGDVPKFNILRKNPQVGIKHFPQVAIKLDSNLWELLDSKLIHQRCIQ